jgi:hypothetical protein
MSAADRFWREKTRTLDWSHIDGPDPYWLSRVTWYSLTAGKKPFPATPGQPTKPRS